MPTETTTRALLYSRASTDEQLLRLAGQRQALEAQATITARIAI